MTCRQEDEADILEYRKLEWTRVPDPTEKVFYDAERNLVCMPPDYWIEVTEYISNTEKNIEILQSWE